MSTILGNVFTPGEKSRLCVLTVERDVLLARPKDDDASEWRFPLRAEFLSFGGDGGSQVVLKNPEGQTLYAERSALQESLSVSGDREFCEKISKEGKRVVKAGRLSLAAFFGFFLACGLGVWILVLLMNWGVDRAVDQIPISWEESLGEMVLESGIGEEIHDKAIVDPIQKLVDQIASGEKNQPYTLTLHVVDNPAVNAFAAPGGHIVVFTGLLEKTEKPEELAGVMAHEFQHVFRRHGLRNMVHSVKWQVVAALLIGDVGSVQHVVLAKAPDFLSLSYGRSLEEEADLEGARLLVRSEIDPQGMIDFFGIMQEVEQDAGISIPEFLSSHPETQKRIDKLEDWLEDEKPGQFQALELEWAELKKAIEERNSSSSEDTAQRSLSPLNSRRLSSLDDFSRGYRGNRNSWQPGLWALEDAPKFRRFGLCGVGRNVCNGRLHRCQN